MFKDYEKYLSTSLKVYLFVLIIIFILKIVGLDYFGLDLTNPTIIKLSDFCLKYRFDIIWYCITYFIYIKFIVSISIQRKVTLTENIFFSLLSILILLYVKPHFNTIGILLFDIIYLIILCLICNKFNNKIKVCKRCLLVLFINFIYQAISLFIRNVNHSDMYMDNFIYGIVLNIDYLLLSLITYEIYFMKGGFSLCGEVSLSSVKKKNLKKSLQKLHKKFQSNLKKFKEKEKVEKLTILIYIILSLIWNISSVILILLIAKLNDTFVECVFILTSFWLSKKSFGKAFHFDSMAKCFIVSNLSYYLLNRLTSPLGISIFIPILLGVGLSYVTSKFVKKSYKPLYRGMPEDVFEDTIGKVVEKNSLKYKICREFYIDKVSDVSLSFKYNYSVAGIRKIKDRINDKIKKLN